MSSANVQILARSYCWTHVASWRSCRELRLRALRLLVGRRPYSLEEDRYRTTPRYATLAVARSGLWGKRLASYCIEAVVRPLLKPIVWPRSLGGYASSSLHKAQLQYLVLLSILNLQSGGNPERFRVTIPDSGKVNWNRSES